MPRSSDTAEIVRMSTDAAQRRQGTGRAILDALVAAAHSWGMAKVILETTTTWAGVIAFYEQNGFTQTHTTPGEFGSDTWFERRLS